MLCSTRITILWYRAGDARSGNRGIHHDESTICSQSSEVLGAAPGSDTEPNSFPGPLHLAEPRESYIAILQHRVLRNSWSTHRPPPETSVNGRALRDINRSIY